MNEDKVRKIVRKGYGKIAKTANSGCGCGCGLLSDVSERVGYSKEDLDSVPAEANMNLGCGNPVALASLKEGEVVIDLGSGGGLDCFLASKKVGKTGKVIGIDMTPEMIDRARANCRRGKYTNVEFRLGEIENLPVADNTADVIISNCVINLSPNKQRVFEEAFRVLKPNGRMLISDMVLLREIPPEIVENVAAYIGCIAGAEKKDKYLELIRRAGFENVQIIEETPMPYEALVTDETAKQIMRDLKITQNQAAELLGNVVSLKVSATKPMRS
ncbi:MAG: arsenite methyltransferase [Candidatus Bathyarchaeota archaeon]|nr:arsenite methyltransferase [Candidatus Bathyarchaeota archaeon]